MMALDWRTSETPRCATGALTRRDAMAKGGNKKRARKKKKANHGKRPNS